MNRSKYRWLINPLFLLVTATCGDNSISGSTCLSGVDSDSDGLTDDVECSLGTDPNNGDSDGDGVLDGQEVAAGANPNSVSYTHLPLTPLLRGAWRDDSSAN